MKRYFLLAAALSVGGCSSSPSVLTASAIPVVQNTGLPAPSAPDTLTETRPYYIGPFDKLSISVFGVPELSYAEVQTDASGQLSFPLVGVIDAVGLTPVQLAQQIAARLRGNYVRDPQVTVNLKETVSQVMTVDGQVVRPGLYPVIGKMTLMRAIATSGGMAEFADLEDVVVFRTVEGQRMAGLYNLKAIRAGAYDDPEVYANDVVVVGDSETRRLFKDIIQASGLITTPLVLLLNGSGTP